jgi:hypothetical protein
MRQPGATQAPRGHELVVSAKKRGRRIQHPDARIAQPLERPEPFLDAVLDAVEVVANVEPPERNVTASEREQRLPRREKLDGNAVPATGCKAEIRRAGAMGDDTDPHLCPL